jgi:hypothetical protein
MGVLDDVKKWTEKQAINLAETEQTSRFRFSSEMGKAYTLKGDKP